MKNKKLENAIDFLIFSYFDLTLSDGNDNDKILKKAIGKAYSDATMQGTFNTLLKTDEQKKNSKAAKEQGQKELISSIRKIFGKNYAKSFDEWHMDICKKLVEVYTDKKITYKEKDESLHDAFSYGNAQKWVNMTIKYLYILHQVYGEYCKNCAFCVEFGKQIDKYSDDFHVPVDRNILISAAKNTKEEKEYGFNIKVPLKKGEKKGSYSDEKAKAWSKWSESDYCDFQNDLKEAIKINFPETKPIDWENPAWIEIAKK